MKLPVGFSKRSRKVFFVIHLWTGLILGLWFALIGLTGSVLAWVPELVTYELGRRYPLENSRPAQPQVPVSQVLARLKQKFPDLDTQEIGRMTMPNQKFPHYMVFLKRNEGTGYPIDPYTGTVHPHYRKSELVIGNISDFHMALLTRPTGHIINGIASAFAVSMLLSGLWLWWPSTVKQLKVRLSIKRGASLRRLMLDLHNISGIYLFGIVFLTTLTAVFMVTNHATEHGVERAINDRLGVPKEEPPMVQIGRSKLSDDQLVATARREVPDLPLISISRSIGPGQPFEAIFYSQYGLLSEVSVTLTPYTGQKRFRWSVSRWGRRGTRRCT